MLGSNTRISIFLNFNGLENSGLMYHMQVRVGLDAQQQQAVYRPGHRTFIKFSKTKEEIGL